MSPLKELVVGARLLGETLGVLDQRLGLFLGEGHEVDTYILRTWSTKASRADPLAIGGSPFKRVWQNFLAYSTRSL